MKVNFKFVFEDVLFTHHIFKFAIFVLWTLVLFYDKLMNKKNRVLKIKVF